MSRIKLSSYSYSNKGSREQNEDSIACAAAEDAGTFVLADGLGGHHGGEVASGEISSRLLEDIHNAERLNGDTLEDIFQSANQLLLEKQQQLQYRTMKTTAVVLDIRDGQALWGHIGDSRLYYFAKNRMEAKTADHSVTYKKYLAGQITAREINFDEDRSSLLRVLGNRDQCTPEILPAPREIHVGDAFLLCSDGLWEYLYDEEILIDFLKAKSPEEWAKLLLLRRIARARADDDNFSVITVFVKPES